MTADTYALDAAYLFGALDADERLAYEAHLATCRRCRASLAEAGQLATRPRPESPSPAAPLSETGRPGESGEVAGVVNAMDGGKSAAVPLDLVNARGAKI